MADNGGHNIFVYTGGEQEVPAGVTHVRIDRSVKIIPRRAFYRRANLVSVETHDGIEIIEKYAFLICTSLRGIKLPGVKVIEVEAFYDCRALTYVEFGDKLETIGGNAFGECDSLRSINMPSVRTIGPFAFINCKQLTDVKLPSVERIGRGAFYACVNLQRIAIPLKEDIFLLDTRQHRYTQFDYCGKLTTVDLVGIEAIHKTISSFLLESWRDEMNQEIDSINQVLPNTPAREKNTDANEKTVVIQEWIESVMNNMEHYKAEHIALLTEAMTQLELNLWKAKLDEKEEEEEDSNLEVQAKKAKIDVESIRKERRITSGASIVIKNVLPFLQLG